MRLSFLSKKLKKFQKNMKNQEKHEFVAEGSETLLRGRRGATSGRAQEVSRLNGHVI
jgi:hypothetical protein